MSRCSQKYSNKANYRVYQTIVKKLRVVKSADYPEHIRLRKSIIITFFECI